MPSDLIDVIYDEVGATNVQQTKSKNKNDEKEQDINGYDTQSEAYGDKVVDKSDLSSTADMFTAYQKSFIRNRLSSNPANLRAIINIFRKFATADIDSMISEIYPGSL